MRVLVLAGALTYLALASGCAGGMIYRHTYQPLSTNFDRTPAATHKALSRGDVKHIHYWGHVLWDTNAIGRIAKEHGLETVYFADLEILSILGFFNQYTVHVYGK
ncbi:MAG: TRL-like family protein [Planctomycetes bacterium]|nr:TRL-like family protein [Planctomycetota bacterium]